MECDIRTLEPGDIYALYEDDADSLRVIQARSSEGIWALPLSADPAPHARDAVLANTELMHPVGRFQVFNVDRTAPPRLAVREDSAGADWAEVVHVPTGQVIRRAPVDECYEFIVENVCEIDRSGAVRGDRK